MEGTLSTGPAGTMGVANRAGYSLGMSSRDDDGLGSSVLSWLLVIKFWRRLGGRWWVLLLRAWPQHSSGHEFYDALRVGGRLGN
jgi:hypothetical protein